MLVQIHVYLTACLLQHLSVHYCLLFRLKHSDFTGDGYLQLLMTQGNYKI